MTDNPVQSNILILPLEAGDSAERVYFTKDTLTRLIDELKKKVQTTDMDGKCIQEIQYIEWEDIISAIDRFRGSVNTCADTLTQRVAEAIKRIQDTMCPTSGIVNGEAFTRIEGRVSQEDFETITTFIEASGAQHLQGLVEALNKAKEYVEDWKRTLAIEVIDKALAALPEEVKG